MKSTLCDESDLYRQPSDPRVENSRKTNLIKGAIRQLFRKSSLSQKIKAFLGITQALVGLTQLHAVASSNGSNSATFATGRKAIRSITCAAILVKISPRPHEVAAATENDFSTGP